MKEMMETVGLTPMMIDAMDGSCKVFLKGRHTELWQQCEADF